MSKEVGTTKSALHIQACTDQLRAALEIEDPVQREAALRKYYFPIPSPKYQYPFLVLNGVAALAWGAKIFADFVSDPGLILYVPVVLCLALFVGDFISAVFHKWLDSYASEVNPIWGSPARAFRVHHEFPSNLNEVGFIHNITSMSWFMTLLYGFSILGAVLFQPGPLLSLFMWIQLLLFTVGNEIHRQAHAERPWAWMGLLQRWGVFLTPERHRKHHVGDRNTDYGIVSGWANPLIDRLDLNTRFDVLLWGVFGLFPRNWIQKPDSIPSKVAAYLKKHPELVPQDLHIYQRLFSK